MTKMSRVQFEITEDQLKELESLMIDCGLRTKKDLLNNALTLFKWAVKHRKAGARITAINEKNGKTIELELPSLSAASSSTRIKH